MVITRVTYFQDKELDVLILHVTKGVVIEVAVMSIKEMHFIADRGGFTYSGKLGCGFKPPIYIHIPGLCVVDYPVQWDVEVEILVLILYLVDSYRQHVSFTIGSSK